MLKILTYKIFFSFCSLSLLVCPGGFYLLFNVIQSKNKIKIISMNFTVYHYIVQHPFKMQI